MKYFKDYIEDYNTATMPSEKYYDIERWEMEQYRLEQIEKSNRSSSRAEISSFDDETFVKEELRKQKERQKQLDFLKIKSNISNNQELREEMKHQETLLLQMKDAYRRGDMETVRKIEKRLAPDEKV